MIQQQQRLSSEIEGSIYRARILYMDDDLGLCSLLQKRLERMACRVEIARDGQEGLTMFANNTYDIVITDYDMPIANGLEVLKQLKDCIPVIMLTGEGDEMVAVEALRLGAADYIIKDVYGKYIEILPSIIDRVLERQQLIKDRCKARTELQSSEARYRAIVEDQTEMICRFELEGKLTFANEAFCRYFGIRQTDIVFQSLAAILPKKAYQHLKTQLKTLVFHNPSAMQTHDIKKIDGSICWVQWTGRAIFVDTSNPKEYQLVGRDITELKKTEAALRASEEKNMALINAIPDPILRIDQQGIFIDLWCKKDHGLYVPAELVGKNITDFFLPDVAELIMNHVNTLFLEEKSQIFQFDMNLGENSSRQEARLVLAGGNEILVILRDITQNNKLEQKLQYLSFHDSLTGLYNRAYFEEEMRRLGNGRYIPVGMVMIDVDGLKVINDTLGHGAGDELLKAASRLISQAFCGNDTVARFGGDEFVVLLPNCSQAVLADACNRLRMNIVAYNQSESKLFLSISIGAAVSSPGSSDLDEVLKQADAAMYCDKMGKSKA